MATQHQPPTSSRRHRRMRARQGGFNFTEVLFAVMILGIGFIMVAAIFPVALQQTKLTGEEVVASTTARGGANFVQQIGLVPRALHVTVLDAPPRTIAAGKTVDLPGMVSSFRDERIPDPNAPGDPPTRWEFRDALWRQIGGNLLLPSDNRAAWVAVYRRGMTFYNPTAADLPHTDPGVLKTSHTYAQVWVIGVQIRNRSTYDLAIDGRRFPNDEPVPLAGAIQPATLEPRMVYVKLYEGDLAPDRVTFHADTSAGAAIVDEGVVGEGACLIISDDLVADDPATPDNAEDGRANGRVYRIGARVGTGDWELAVGEDMSFRNPDGVAGTADDEHEQLPQRAVAASITVPAPGSAVIAYLVGRGYANPEVPADGYEGSSQVTGVYTTFIPAN